MGKILMQSIPTGPQFDSLTTEVYNVGDFQFSLYNVLEAGMIILIVWLMLKGVNRYFQHLAKKNSLEAGSYKSIYLLIKYFAIIVTVILVLETLGVKISVLLASMTALLVGIGLGIQQYFTDIMSGVILLFERHLKINDVIELESHLIGKVVKISLRTSMLKTRDDIFVIVPNSQLVNDKIINWSLNEFKTRFSVSVGVSYDSDVRKVEKVLYDCVESQEGVDDENEPFVMFHGYGDSALDFEVYFYTHQSFRVERIKSEIRFKIFDAFRAEGIVIPFPQMDLHVKDLPPGEMPGGVKNPRVQESKS